GRAPAHALEALGDVGHRALLPRTYYPESVDTFADALYEIQPTFVFTVPRYLQKFAAHLLVGLDQRARLTRAAYRLAMTASGRALEGRYATSGEKGSAALAAVANALVFR